MAEERRKAPNIYKKLSEQEKAITRIALVKIAAKYGLNPPKCSKMLYAFGKDKAALHYGFSTDYQATFSVNERSFRSYLIESGRPTKDDVVNGIHIWLKTDFPRDFQTEKIRYLIQSNYTDISALSELFLGDSELNIDAMHNLEGRYMLYRPSHLNPDHDVSIVDFSIGINSKTDEANICSCNYYSIHENDEEDDDTHAEGHIVTNGKNGAAFLKTSRKKPLLLMIDHIKEGTSKEPEIKSFGGIILAGVTSIASAWPFYAVRVADEEFKTSTMPYVELKLKSSVIERLNRGSIRWKEVSYLGWPHKKE